MVTVTKISLLLGFIEPTEFGYCVPVGSKNAKAEHCRCPNVDSIAKCQELCQNDDRCNGFSLLEENNNCHIYTPSNCDSTKYCHKRNQAYSGEIKAATSLHFKSTESGCYIKKRGKL